MRNFKNQLFLLIFIFVAALIDFFLIFKIKELENDMEKISLAQSNMLFKNKLKNKNETIRLFFVGDIMLDRGVEYITKKYGLGDWRFPFLKIQDHLQKADLLFGNLESLISDKGAKVGSIYSFRAEPGSVEALKFAGFDILSVANNHIFDYGRNAMEDSFHRLKEANLYYVGGGFLKSQACAPLIIEIEPVKIAFLGYSNIGSRYWEATDSRSGICWLDEENLKEGIKQAKTKADLVIVSVHWGNEYQSKESEEQQHFGHLAIDWGADLVIGHHSHVIQPLKKYKNGFIAYSLGNFLFDQGFSKRTMQGLLLEVMVENKKIAKIISKEIKLNKFFQPELRNY